MGTGSGMFERFGWMRGSEAGRCFRSVRSGSMPHGRRYSDSTHSRRIGAVWNRIRSPPDRHRANILGAIGARVGEILAADEFAVSTNIYPLSLWRTVELMGVMSRRNAPEAG